jgi:Domain of unknown function (DUF4394)
MVRTVWCLITLLAVAGCAGLTSLHALPPERPETVFATTSRNELISFNAGRPGVILTRAALTGMQPGERLAGIDFRPANGKLYGLGTTFRLYIIDSATGAATIVSSGTQWFKLLGTEIGFDFNPIVDRIRVVSDRGENLRLHPDTGAVVDADPARNGLQIDVTLRYDDEDQNAGRLPRITGAAYTNSGVNDAKATTNYAIDAILGVLVTQGQREGTSPAYPPATPNTGLLFTVGALGVQPDGAVSFDIAHGAASGAASKTGIGGTAFASFIPLGKNTTHLYQINLATGAATEVGIIDRGEPVTGIAIQP